MDKMKKKKINKIFFRKTIVCLLLASMMLETGSMQSLAAETLPGQPMFTAEDTINETTGENAEDNTGGSSNESMRENIEASSGNISNENTGEDTGNDSDENIDENSGNSSDGNAGNGSDGNADENAGDDSNENMEGNAGNDLNEAEDGNAGNNIVEDINDSMNEDSSEGLDETEKNSTNMLGEMSIENALEKPNTLGQTEKEILEAEDAFADILSEKDLMALIYLTDAYSVRSEADDNGSVVATLESGHTVYLRGVTIKETKIWYLVQFWSNGSEIEGYVLSNYLAYADEDWKAWEEKYLKNLVANKAITFNAINGLNTYANTDVEQFPADYQSALRELKSAHPNWIFVPMNTNLDFNTVVSNEMGDKSLIQATTSNKEKGWVGDACPTESGWYYATKDAVSYYIDSRNFLTETYIFQFEQLTFNSSYHTVAAVQSFLNSTFMKGTLSDDSQNRTYAQAFHEIGSSKKLSPIHLAARVYQEQGQGTSGLISGSYPGYEGYYNYFNVGVNGSSEQEKIIKGLTYAKEQGWNTRYKSLDGGASTIGKNYILKGQDTIYLEKFNVEASSPYGLYNHQYMQNIQAPASESSSTKKMYNNAGSLNSAFVFKIPVYNNMPGQNALRQITLDKDEITLRRPDTVVEDTEHLDEEAKKTNISTITLQVLFDPEDTTDDKTIEWSSSNNKVATVTDGVVTAVGIGQADITAKASNAGGQTAKCTVTVIAPVCRIEFSPENNVSDILVGQSTNLSVEYFPKDTSSDTTVNWESSDTSVATVSKTKGTVRGEGNGTATITAAIGGYQASHKMTVSSCSVIFKDKNGGNNIKVISTAYGKTVPEEDFPVMKDSENDDQKGTDDEVFIGWYTGVKGTGSRFDSETKIYQKETIVYPYFEEQGKGFYVIPIGDQIYTGSAIKPTVEVYDSVSYTNGNQKRIPLILNQDYTVSYKNNTNIDAGSSKIPTITIKGKGNYTGTETVTFHIIPKTLTDADITADNITAAYTGKTIKSNPVVYRNGKKLTKNTHYTVTYPQIGTGAYQNTGTYPIIITGKGNYSGSITVYETITKNILMSKVSIAKITNQSYDASQIDKENNIGMEPTLTVTYKNNPLQLSTDGGLTGDYTVSYSNNMEIGTATATITAIEGSGFSGSKSITFKITGTSISKAVIDGTEALTFAADRTESGMEQNLSALSVTLSGMRLTASKDGGKTGDYTVSYLNNKKVGTATVVISGINSYTGTKKKTFKINAYDLSQDALSSSPAILMKYCTEEEIKGASEKEIEMLLMDKPYISSLNEITTPYMKGGAKPQVFLYYHSGDGSVTKLVSGKDYTISYKNNNAVMDTVRTLEENPEVAKLPTITVKGKGNYKGSLTGLFSITDGKMSDHNNKITMTAKDVVYKVKKGFYKTTLTLTDANGKKLQAGKDYEKVPIYTYENATTITTIEGDIIVRNSGEVVQDTDVPEIGATIRVRVKGIGAYAGTEPEASLSTVYRIAKADIAKAKVKQVVTKTYDNGEEITLDGSDIEVTLNGETLICGIDYIINSDTYVNNIKKGKGTVVITGIGTNYGGTKKISFSIGRKTLVWWRKYETQHDSYSLDACWVPVYTTFSISKDTFCISGYRFPL